MIADSKKKLMCFLAVVLLLGSGSLAKADKEATLKAVIRAWGKKQQETTSFRFEWIETMFTPKDQLPRPAKEDAKYQKKSGVIVSDSRMTTYSEGPLWSMDRFITKQYRSVFDGTNSKSFNVEMPEGVHPLGNVNSIRMNQDADSNFCVPIQLAYRPFHPVMGRFEEAKIQVIDEKSYIKERECARIEQNRTNYVARCWVDTKRDYAIVRYAMVFDGFPVYQCDVEYKKDNVFGWIPESWHDILINNNMKPARLSDDRVVQVKSFEINGPVKDQEFQLEFPPRTEVHDWIKDQLFIVLDDGTKRFETPEEIRRGVPYEELLHPKEITRVRNLLVVAIIAVLGVLLNRIRKKMRKPA